MITFALNSKSGVPIYRQIQDQIRYGIASAKLQAGEQLPTVRALAVDLGVNPNTVIKAYSELEREGLLSSEQGSGTFISRNRGTGVSSNERRRKLQTMCGEFLADAARYGFGADEVIEAIQALMGRMP
jgi:GntR family transcriptional regulator